MSTPNFEFMKYGMPLIVADMDYYDQKEQYEQEYGDDEEYNEDMFYDDMTLKAEEMEALADEINKTLEYFRVEVKDGYYCDLQFVVRTYEDLDFDRESPYCIDNEDAHYYFDECRSKVLRKTDAEQCKVYKWLKSLKKQGYTELGCDGVFSNGEAIYSRI